MGARTLGPGNYPHGLNENLAGNHGTPTGSRTSTAYPADPGGEKKPPGGFGETGFSGYHCDLKDGLGYPFLIGMVESLLPASENPLKSRDLGRRAINSGPHTGT